MIARFAVLVMLCLGVGWAAQAQPHLKPTPEQDIRKLLVDTFDRPDQPLAIGPIVAEGDAAVVGWTQGALGGRALLRLNGGVWTLVACAGDALKQPTTLQNLGLTSSQATTLAAKLHAAERDLPAERLRALASFNGLQDMRGGDAPHAHPPTPSAR